MEPDSPSNVFDGNLVPARLVSDHAQQMERVGMIRRDGKNLLINLLGRLQPSGLMVSDRRR